MEKNAETAKKKRKYRKITIATRKKNLCQKGFLFFLTGQED